MAKRASVTVRPMAATELEAVCVLERESFGGEAEAMLVRALAKDPAAWVPDLSLVAVEDGRIAGHVLFTRAHVGGVPAVLLAPLAVASDRRRAGLGGTLVREGLARARELGAALALVLGDPAYYGRFGFAAAGPYGIEPPYPVEPAEAWMALELEPGALWAARGAARLAEAFMDPDLWRE